MAVWVWQEQLESLESFSFGRISKEALDLEQLEQSNSLAVMEVKGNSYSLVLKQEAPSPFTWSCR